MEIDRSDMTEIYNLPRHYWQNTAPVAIAERLEVVLLSLEHQEPSLREHAIALVPARDAESRLC